MIRNPFRPLYVCWRLFITGWALQELNPTDPRVPEIVRERHSLQERACR